jgi:hypothetical protein
MAQANDANINNVTCQTRVPECGGTKKRGVFASSFVPSPGQTSKPPRNRVCDMSRPDNQRQRGKLAGACRRRRTNAGVTVQLDLQILQSLRGQAGRQTAPDSIQHRRHEDDPTARNHPTWASTAGAVLICLPCFSSSHSRQQDRALARHIGAQRGAVTICATVAWREAQDWTGPSKTRGR